MIVNFLHRETSSANHAPPCHLVILCEQHGKKFAGQRVIHVDESKKGSLVAEEIKAKEMMRLLQRGGEIRHAYRERMREKKYAEEHGQVYTPENHPKNHHPAHLSRSFEGFVDAMRVWRSHSGDQDGKGMECPLPHGIDEPLGANKSRAGAAERGEGGVVPPASKTEKKMLAAAPPVDLGGAPVDSKSREKKKRRRGGVVDADKVRSIAEVASRIEAALKPHIGNYLDEGAFMSPRVSVVGKEGSHAVDGGMASDDEVIPALPLEVESDTLFSPRTPRLVVQVCFRLHPSPHPPLCPSGPSHAARLPSTTTRTVSIGPQRPRFCLRTPIRIS